MSVDNLYYEKQLITDGHRYIAGTDEVGRGCLAGPIIAAAVILPPEITTSFYSFPEDVRQHLGLINDSKKLSDKKRQILSQFIKEFATEYKVCELNNMDIDTYGVGECNKRVLQDSILQLKKVDAALIDHFKIDSEIFKSKQIELISITKGDEKSISIAAASIIAKVYRDDLMKNTYHYKFPMYGFNKNVGYGTKLHLDAIKQHGYSPIHRMSFSTNLS